jgi:hypothetical protein
MSKDFPYLQIPNGALRFVGERVGNSRVYRRYGTDRGAEVWFNVLEELFPKERFVSPGGVTMFCPVSRPAVHKRAKEGKLTMFTFHVTDPIGRFFGASFKRGIPYAYVPVSEAKAWRKEIEERLLEKGKLTQDELEGSRPDWEGDFLEWHSKWAKEQARLKKKEERKK